MVHRFHSEYQILGDVLYLIRRSQSSEASLLSDVACTYYAIHATESCPPHNDTTTTATKKSMPYLPHHHDPLAWHAPFQACCHLEAILLLLLLLMLLLLLLPLLLLVWWPVESFSWPW
jgi:hypothetical protein